MLTSAVTEEGLAQRAADCKKHHSSENIASDKAMRWLCYDVSKRGLPVRVVNWSGILRQTKAFTYFPKADARRKSVR